MAVNHHTAHPAVAGSTPAQRAVRRRQIKPSTCSDADAQVRRLLLLRFVGVHKNDGEILLPGRLSTPPPAVVQNELVMSVSTRQACALSACRSPIAGRET
jgi:hypothetical protein